MTQGSIDTRTSYMRLRLRLRLVFWRCKEALRPWIPYPAIVVLRKLLGMQAGIFPSRHKSD